MLPCRRRSHPHDRTGPSPVIGTTAMLLGGLTIHGIQPGPLMQQNNPVFTYMIFLSALLAAILCLLVEIFGIRWFPKLLDAPYHFLYLPSWPSACWALHRDLQHRQHHHGLLLHRGRPVHDVCRHPHHALSSCPSFWAARWRTTSARPSATARVTGPCSSPVRSPASC